MFLWLILHLYRFIEDQINEWMKHDQCGDTIEKSQAPDDGRIHVRNMLSIEVK